MKNRTLAALAALVLAAPACDRLAQKRHALAREHAVELAGALERGDASLAVIAAQAAADADPYDPAMRELPVRVRLVVLARWPELVTIERAGELDYSAQTLLRHETAHRAELLIARGLIAASRGDGAGAEKLMNEAVQAKDAPALALVALARLKLRQGQTAEATASFQKALEADPANVAASIGLGEQLLRENKAAEAEKLLQASLAKHEESAALRRTLAVALYSLKKVAEAGEQLQRSVALEPSSGVAHRALAEWLVATDQLDRAETEYTAGTKLGDELQSTFGLGTVAARKKEFPRAAQLFEAVLRAQPQAFDAAFEAGAAWEAAGQDENAAKAYARYVQGASSDPQAQAKVAEATRRYNALVAKAQGH